MPVRRETRGGQCPGASTGHEPVDAPPPPRHVASTVIQQTVFVKGQLNRVSALLLVDTNSTVTLVHKTLFEGSRGPGGGLQEISGSPVVAANGQPLQILGVFRSSFNVAGTEFSHDALVTEDMSQDCLLGADFLLSHNFVVDLKDNMLRKESLSTPLFQLSSRASRVCLVSVVNNVVMRAGEERPFLVDVKSCSSLPTGVAGVTEPKERFEVRHQLLFARVVAVPTHGQIPL